MEKVLNLILDELKNLNTRVANIEAGQIELNQRIGNLELRVGNIEARLEGVEARVGNIESRVDGIEAKVDKIDNELKEFRNETKISLQIIQSGQQGTREEMTQRFKEVKHTLGHLESDIANILHKTAEHDMKLNRMKGLWS